MQLILDFGTHSLKAAWKAIRLSPDNGGWSFESIDLKLEPPFQKKDWLSKIEIAIQKLSPRLPKALSQIHLLLPSACFEFETHLKANPFDGLLKSSAELLKSFALEPDFIGSGLLAQTQYVMHHMQGKSAILLTSGHAETLGILLENQNAELLFRDGNLGGLATNFSEEEPLPVSPSPISLQSPQSRRILQFLKAIEQKLPKSALKCPIILTEGGSARVHLETWCERMMGTEVFNMAQWSAQHANPAWLPPQKGIFDPIFCHVMEQGL